MSFSKILKSDFIKDTLKRAQPLIAEDRGRFKKCYDVVETYCKNNNIFISNKSILFGEKKLRESYNLYCLYPFQHALNMVNLIHSETLEPLLLLKTIKKNEELTIFVDTRAIINVYAIYKIKDIDPDNIIHSMDIKGLKYLPPEIEIIEIYNNLYDLSKFGDWEQLKTQDEPRMYEMIRDRMQSTITTSSKKYGGVDCQPMRKDKVNMLKIDIIKNLFNNNTDYILTGIWGANIFLKSIEDLCGSKLATEKLQVISNLSYDMILKDINNICGNNIKVTAKERELHLPKDFRTTRTTFYAQFGDSKIEKPFIDVFNSNSFELIPYSVKEGLSLAGKYVMLRFLFIDFWLLKTITYMNLIDLETAKLKSANMKYAIDRMRDSIEPIYKYSGIYRDYDIDRRLRAAEGGYKNIYLPHKYYLENNNTYYQLPKKEILGGIFIN
jgi:hypothetical protein